MKTIRWASLLTVLGCVVVGLVSLFSLLRGRTWAWFPLLVAVAVGFREIRYLQRSDHQRNAPR
ncbi:hypothetical protein [Oerskovia sp. USHLN155]|uniref:hypothetical protein n=1 Tax=Oerskovia sp. USHLN155 TaxID=3081288 RepID=UPI0030176D61